MLRLLIFSLSLVAIVVCCNRSIPEYPYKGGPYYFDYDIDPANVMPDAKKPLRLLSQKEVDDRRKQSLQYYGITFDEKGRIVEMASYIGEIWQVKDTYLMKGEKSNGIRQERNPMVFQQQKLNQQVTALRSESKQWENQPPEIGKENVLCELKLLEFYKNLNSQEYRTCVEDKNCASIKVWCVGGCNRPVNKFRRPELEKAYKELETGCLNKIKECNETEEKCVAMTPFCDGNKRCQLKMAEH